MIPRRSTKRFRALLLSALFAVVFATLPSVRLTPRAHAQAPGKKPITHEAMWLMKRVGAPVPSPDGKWVVFSLVEPSYDESAQVTDLWVVPSDGSAKPRRLTATKGGEGGAAWSPDSRRLAFSARREGDETAQIYVLDVADGGEAVRVTNVSMGARAPQWRPDGRALLFTSNLYIGAADEEANKKIAAERKAQKFRARAYDSFPIRRWDKWLEDTKPHIFVQSVEQGARPVDLLANTNLIREPGFAGRETNAGEELDAVWSPDGESVVFNASTKANTAAYAFYGTHLFQVSARGGSQPVQITNGAAEYAQPAFSPDGRSLYSLTTSQAGKVYYLSRLAKFNWPSPGQPVILTSTFDRAVSNFAVSPDSKTVYLTAEDAGLEKLYTVPASGGEVRLAFDMTRGTYTNLRSPARAPSTVLVANWESATNPAELVRIDPRSNTHRALTDFNAQAASQIDWQPLRHFWFTSRGGKRVHSMIALPPNFDENRRYPLLVLMHGGPHTMWRDQYFLRWNYHLLARPGYVVLLTNYTGSTGFGEKFAQDIQGDPFKTPADEINQAADEAARQFRFVDAANACAGGASYGGHLANWMQATTTRYKCLISHAGLINVESQWGTSDVIYHREVGAGGPVWEQGAVWKEQNPIRFAANFKTPILLTVGENDFRVPLNQTLENWSVLQRQRVPSRLVVFPDENHWIQKGENSRYFYQEVHAWLRKYLGPPAAETSGG